MGGGSSLSLARVNNEGWRNSYFALVLFWRRSSGELPPTLIILGVWHFKAP